MQVTPALGRPPRENWTLRDSRGSDPHDFRLHPAVSTNDLLGKAEFVPEDGIAATYSFQRDCSKLQPARLPDYARGALIGAAWGAGITTVGGAVLGAVGDALTQTFPALFQSAGVGVAACAVLGAGFGSLAGALSAWESRWSYAHYGESVSGTLRRPYGPDGQQHLVFQPYPRFQKVDLAEFARLPIIPGGEPGKDKAPNWWQAGTPVMDP